MRKSHKKRGCATALLAIAASTMGCGGNAASADGSAGAAGQAGSGGGAPLGPIVPLRVTLMDFLGGGGPSGDGAIEGAEVCIIEPPADCGTTDTNGFVEGTIPAGVPVVLRVTKDGLLTSILQGVADETDGLTFDVTLPTTEVAQAFAAVVGLTFPDLERGVVSVNVLGPPPPGVPPLPLAGGRVTFHFPAEGPFYLRDDDFPDSSLMETSSRGIGFIAPVPPGDHTLTYQHPDFDCVEPWVGWPGAAPDEVVVRVEPNTLTVSGAICKPP